MANAPLGLILQHMRRFVGAPAVGDWTDGQLLDRFLANHDEAAFTELVQRHGPMVLGVCRRVLGNAEDAEDAFQATFLMLAHKAGSIRLRGAVSGWLFEVAHHLALDTRAAVARRRAHERRATEMLKTTVLPDEPDRETRAAFEEELLQLPERYRTLLILCYLEGKTTEHAARELGWPLGSMSRHLARAKELLRERVAARGVLLSTGVIFAQMVDNAPAAVPMALLQSTVKAAVLLAAGETIVAGLVSVRAAVLVKEMMRTMFIAKLKFAAALSLIVGALGMGGLVLMHQAGGEVAAAEGASADAAKGAAAAARPVRTDLFGDPLPDDAQFRLGTNRLRHSTPVTYVAFLPDGKQVLTESQDGIIRLWDAADGKEVRRFARQADGSKPQVVKEPEDRLVRLLRRATGFSGRVALAPDGKTLAFTDTNGAIQLCDVATGKNLRRFPAPPASTALLLFSPDGKALLARGLDRATYLFETATGKEKFKLKGPETEGDKFQVLPTLEHQKPMTRTIFTAAFAPDGQTLATVDADEDEKMPRRVVLRLWEAATGKEIRQIAVPESGVSALAFAPDGKTLAYASAKAIHLCDPATGKEIRRMEGPVGGIVNLAFARDGKTLAAKAVDEVVRLWEVETGKEGRPVGEAVDGRNESNKLPGIHQFKDYLSARDLALSPDGLVVATGAGTHTVRLWQAGTGQELLGRGHRGPVEFLAASPDGKSLISYGTDGTVRRWDAGSGKQLNQLPVPEGTTCLAFAQETLALANRDKTIRVYLDGRWDGSAELEALPSSATVLAFSPNGKVLGARAADGSIHLIDMVKGGAWKPIALPADNKPAAGGNNAPGPRDVGLAFSPDGQMLAAVRGNMLYLADVGVGKVVRKIIVPGQRGVASFAFSPDGRNLATENADSTLTLWEVASGKERGELGKPAADPRPNQSNNPSVSAAPAPQSLAFAPDGRLLACRSANQVQVWDLLTHQEIKQLKGHDGRVEALAFTADGKALASGSSDTTILLWDLGAPRVVSTPQPEFSAQELDALWADLTADHAGKAFQSMRKLAMAPRPVVPFLQAQLKPATLVDPKRIEQWVVDLDSEQLVTRKQAEEELRNVGALARPALEKVLASQPALDTRKRVDALLETAASGLLAGEQLRLVRAVELLEQLGTPEARQILETLAKGAPGALPTRTAQAALDRLVRKR